jgi:hypothetical protein
MVMESGREGPGGGKDWFGEVAVGVPSGLGEPEKLLFPPILTVSFTMVKSVPAESVKLVRVDEVIES